VAGTQILGGRTKIKGGRTKIKGGRTKIKGGKTKIKGMMLCGWHSDPRREDQDQGNDAAYACKKSDADLAQI